MKFKITLRSTIITGFLMGLLAAVIQFWFLDDFPYTYGICMFGHPKDLVSYVLNKMAGTNLHITEAFIYVPTLLAIGVILGSIVSASRNGELKWQSGPIRNIIPPIAFGFLVANFGLLWGACPIRTGLLVSSGNLMALVALSFMALGVLLAVAYIRFRTSSKVLNRW